MKIRTRMGWGVMEKKPPFITAKRKKYRNIDLTRNIQNIYQETRRHS